jgi:hypothetical protein
MADTSFAYLEATFTVGLYECLFTQIFVPPRCHRFNYNLEAIARAAANDFKNGAMTRHPPKCGLSRPP